MLRDSREKHQEGRPLPYYCSQNNMVLSLKIGHPASREKTYDHCCQENASATREEMQMMHKSGVHEMIEQIPGKRERGIV